MKKTKLTPLWRQTTVLRSQILDDRTQYDEIRSDDWSRRYYQCANPGERRHDLELTLHRTLYARYVH